MVEFEIVKIGDAIYVSINGVMSTAFARQSIVSGRWFVEVPKTSYVAEALDEAVALIAEGLGNWYTIAQGAERLVEMGAFDEAPSSQMMGIWCRAGRFPGAVKVRGKGARGGGGAWRIPETALPIFAEWREGR